MVLGAYRVEMLADLQAGEAEPVVAGFKVGLQGSEGGKDITGRCGGLEGFLEIINILVPQPARGGDGSGGVGVAAGLEGAKTMAAGKSVRSGEMS